LVGRCSTTGATLPALGGFIKTYAAVLRGYSALTDLLKGKGKLLFVENETKLSKTLLPRPTHVSREAVGRVHLGHI
jgi:hypothetical protein